MHFSTLFSWLGFQRRSRPLGESIQAPPLQPAYGNRDVAPQATIAGVKIGILRKWPIAKLRLLFGNLTPHDIRQMIRWMDHLELARLQPVGDEFDEVREELVALLQPSGVKIVRGHISDANCPLAIIEAAIRANELSPAEISNGLVLWLAARLVKSPGDSRLLAIDALLRQICLEIFSEAVPAEFGGES